MKRFYSKFGIGLIQIGYWGALSFVPVAINNSIGEFMIESGCFPGTDCLKMMAKFLYSDLANITIASALLIWPIAIWKIVAVVKKMVSKK